VPLLTDAAEQPGFRGVAPAGPPPTYEQTMTDVPRPTELNLHQKSRILEISYANGERFELSYEFLRVHSPSAEVQGHGPGQGVLQVGKEDVMITHVEPVGSYAIQPSFDDGHDTGIYSWETLYNMGKNKDKYWQEYLQKLAAAGHKRREIN
jgi:DUF971 family protein